MSGKYFDRAKELFEEEIAELHQLGESIGEEFDRAVEAILACQGKLVLMGIGKTGIVAHKIASSLASTGTPSIFVNAAEAVHGDLGMISPEDIVLLVSNSGSTNEILNVLAPVKRIGATTIAMTGNTDSPLAHDCDLVLSVHVDKEACPLGLAPTTSTTATMMMGDALVVCLMEARHFEAENFSLYHPGGALGRKLLGRVRQHMHAPIPLVGEDASFKQIVQEVTDHHFGTTFVGRSQQEVVGIITDGDIRRTIQRFDSLDAVRATDILSPNYKHIHADALLTEALALMDEYNITTLAVTPTKENPEVVGILSIHHIIDFQPLFRPSGTLSPKGARGY